MNNRLGNKYGLTTISPIIIDLDLRPAPNVALRRRLAELPNGTASPLARIPAIHAGRWFVLDDLLYQGFPSKKDTLKSSYLVFDCIFDGDLIPTLGALVKACPEEVTEIWSYCVGFPGISDFEAFVHYVERCQIPTGLFFGDMPEATTEEVLRALMVQQKFIRFWEEMQGRPASELQQEFQKFSEEVRKCRTPAPGSERFD